MLITVVVGAPETIMAYDDLSCLSKAEVNIGNCEMSEDQSA